MHFSLLALSAAIALPLVSGGNLPGLSATQSKHAQDIIAEAKREGLGLHGCTAGIATALVEVRTYQHSPLGHIFLLPLLIHKMIN